MKFHLQIELGTEFFLVFRIQENNVLDNRQEQYLSKVFGKSKVIRLKKGKKKMKICLISIFPLFFKY